jgi:hypothetical protein
MLVRPENLGIESDEASEHLRINSVVLQLAFGDEPHSTRAANNHLVTEGIKKARQPGG